MPRKRLVEQTRYNRECKHAPSIPLTFDFETYYGIYSLWADKERETTCPWGNCIITVCPTCNRITGGMGPVACPCDHVRGWERPYVDAMGRQPVALKPKGRHADRIRNRQREYRRALARLDTRVERLEGLG